MADQPAIDPQEILGDLGKLDPVALDLSRRAQALAKKLGLPTFAQMYVGIAAAATVQTVVAIIGVIITVLVYIGTPIIQVFLRILTKARTDTVPEQLEISAAVLSEFLATEISTEHLKPGKTGDQTIDAANAIGKALLGRLTKEFVPQGEVTPESGEQAAATFAGYGVNFAVQNTIISTLADALSYHLLEDFRELGVEVAQNLGLGRLVRQALLPLIRNAIAEPYDQALRKRYRPDRLSDAQYIRSFVRGNLTFEELRDRLAIKGFKEEDIDRLISDQLPNLSDTEVSALIRYGDLTEDAGVKALAEAGIPEGTARQKLRVNDIGRTDAVISIYKSLIGKQRVDGLLSEDEYNKLLDRLPITDEEKQQERNFIGQSLEVPRAFLTWSEVTKAFELGVVDFDYLDRWLKREGFSDEDALTKELLLLDAFGKFTTKEQAAADRAARKSGQKPQ